MAEQTPADDDAQYRTSINVEQGATLQLQIGQGDNARNAFETLINVFQNLNRNACEKVEEEVERPALSEEDKSEEGKKLVAEIVKIQDLKQSQLLTLCATLEYYAKIKDERGFLEANEIFNKIVKAQKDIDDLRSITKTYESSKKYFRAILMTKAMSWWSANNNKPGGMIEPAAAMETMARCISNLDAVWEAMKDDDEEHQEDFSTPYFDSFCQEILQNLRDVDKVDKDVKQLTEAQALVFSSLLCFKLKNWQEGSDICGTAIDILETVLGEEAKSYPVFGIAKLIGAACKAATGNCEAALDVMDEAMADVKCVQGRDEDELGQLLSAMQDAKSEIMNRNPKTE